MDRRPIGIFDSGVGGLTALRSLRALLPCEDLIFLADTARVPYGVRGAGELNAIAEDNFLLLESLGVKAVLAACGTVSANCAALIDGWPTPACGVLEPSVRAAAAAARGRAGVLATEATVRSGAFERLFASIAPELELLSRGNTELVPLAEAGRTSPGDAEVRAALERALEPFRAAGTDTLILGCTHFPLFSEAVKELLPGVTLINSGEAGARAAAALCSGRGLLNPGPGPGSTHYFVSGDISSFAAAAARFLPGGIEAAEISRAERERS